MSSVQPHLEQLSLSLSEVLDDIGVDNAMTQKRRQSALFREYASTVNEVTDDNRMVVHIIGSQTEGITTLGLDSDIDILYLNTGFNVINDWSYWDHCEKNLLMVQDDSTAPGYCLLQLLRDDAPLAAEYIPDHRFCIDNKGRVLLKNTVFHHLADRCIQHSPAVMSPGRPGMVEIDIVQAFDCTQWPVEARRWLTRDNADGWPDVSLKSRSEQCGCFLVPLDSKISGLVGVEWRISTTLAERYLMFSLNNIHMKCYVMMKVLIKSYDVFHDVISSYMCKTAILHCVENTMADFWQERNLITCLDKILCVLYNFIVHVKCPHFIIPENNLMAGRISPIQQQRLLEVLERIIRSDGRMLLDIQMDNIGARLRQKIHRLPIHAPHIRSKLEIHRLFSGDESYHSACAIRTLHNDALYRSKNQCCKNTIKQLVCKYKDFYNLYPHLSSLQQKAARHISSLMSTTIGSLMVSYSMSIDGGLPERAIEWLKFGLKSDVSSSVLKLATVYYSVGDMNVTEKILTHIDQRYDRNVVLPVCACIAKELTYKEGFLAAANNGQITDYRHLVSYCVCFTYNELNIVPLEMRQEFFRSSQEEIQRRDPVKDRWMDFSVVDSLPYLYFLQYKTYNSLGKNEEKLTALNKLKNVMIEEPNIRHKETVYNLLGQCMEQENLPNDAFHYYERSLQVRPKHNAANFYRARLLSI
ncbi:hypothetical protein ACF0H5_021300 [Mactra antiquata]